MANEVETIAYTPLPHYASFKLLIIYSYHISKDKSETGYYDKADYSHRNQKESSSFVASQSYCSTIKAALAAYNHGISTHGNLRRSVFN